jgi:hypothetical protein
MKKQHIILSIILVVFTIIPLYSDTIISSATYTAFVDFEFRNAKINHTEINTISKEFGVFNLKSSVDFGDYVSAEAYMLYYLNDDVVNITTVTKGRVEDDATFYIEIDPSVLKSKEKVNYRIVAKLRKAGEQQYTEAAWFPSSTTFHTAMIADSTSTAITASAGGTVEFASGNQEYGNTKVVVPAGVLSGDTNITIKQLSLSQARSVQSQTNTSAKNYKNNTSMTASNNLDNQLVALYSVTSYPKVEISGHLATDFYYGSDTDLTKFDIKYRADATSSWEKVKLEKIDTVLRIVNAKISKFGEYGIFISSNLSDNDYRPPKRVRVKSRIKSGRYPGFEFRYLQEGDVVKIYNVNGKKIAELTDIVPGESTFWKGRKDANNSGDWAESGTYIYQIKLKEKGKIISGTIAFVW